MLDDVVRFRYEDTITANQDIYLGLNNNAIITSTASSNVSTDNSNVEAHITFAINNVTTAINAGDTIFEMPINFPLGPLEQAITIVLTTTTGNITFSFLGKRLITMENIPVGTVFTSFGTINYTNTEKLPHLLLLDKDTPIVGMKNFDNLLMFCDFNKNEPYCINIDRARASFNWISPNPLFVSSVEQNVVLDFNSYDAPTQKNYGPYINTSSSRIINTGFRTYQSNFDISANTEPNPRSTFITYETILGDDTIQIVQNGSGYFNWIDFNRFMVDFNGLTSTSTSNNYKVDFYSSILPTFTHSSGISNVSIQDKGVVGSLHKYELLFTIDKNTQTVDLTKNISITAFDGVSRFIEVHQSKFGESFFWIDGPSKSTDYLNKRLSMSFKTNEPVSITTNSPHIGDISYTINQDNGLVYLVSFGVSTNTSSSRNMDITIEGNYAGIVNTFTLTQSQFISSFAWDGASTTKIDNYSQDVKFRFRTNEPILTDQPLPLYASNLVISKIQDGEVGDTSLYEASVHIDANALNTEKTFNILFKLGYTSTIKTFTITQKSSFELVFDWIGYDDEIPEIQYTGGSIYITFITNDIPFLTNPYEGHYSIAQVGTINANGLTSYSLRCDVRLMNNTVNDILYRVPIGLTKSGATRIAKFVQHGIYGDR